MIHVRWAREVEPPSGVDMRTRGGQEAHVMAQIHEFGGFEVFWATAHQKRACAIDRLSGRGEIERVDDGKSFPWCTYRVSGERGES